MRRVPRFLPGYSNSISIVFNVKTSRSGPKGLGNGYFRQVKYDPGSIASTKPSGVVEFVCIGQLQSSLV